MPGADALSSEDYQERLQFVKSVLDHRETGATAALLERLKVESHLAVKAALVYTLGRLGDRAVIPAISRLTRDPEAVVRLRAVEALNSINDPSTYPILMRVLGGDPDPKVRDLAAHHLLSLGRARLLNLFHQMLSSEKPWMRQAAILGCRMFGSPLTVRLLAHSAEVEIAELRAEAVEGLEALAGRNITGAAEALARFKAPPTAPTAEAPSTEVNNQEKIAKVIEEVSAAEHLQLDDTYFGGANPKVEMDHFTEHPAEPPPQTAPEARVAPPQNNTKRKISAFTLSDSGERATEPPLAAAPVSPPPSRDMASSRTTRETRPTPILQGPNPISGSTLGMDRSPVSLQGRRDTMPMNASGSGAVAAGPPSLTGSQSGSATRPCPLCGEEIAATARKCRFCQIDSGVLPPPEEVGPRPRSKAIGAITTVTLFSLLLLIWGFSSLKADPIQPDLTDYVNALQPIGEREQVGAQRMQHVLTQSGTKTDESVKILRDEVIPWAQRVEREINALRPKTPEVIHMNEAYAELMHERVTSLESVTRAIETTDRRLAEDSTIALQHFQNGSLEWTNKLHKLMSDHGVVVRRTDH